MMKTKMNGAQTIFDLVNKNEVNTPNNRKEQMENKKSVREREREGI